MYTTTTKELIKTGIKVMFTFGFLYAMTMIINFISALWILFNMI